MNRPVAPVHHYKIHSLAGKIANRCFHLSGMNGLAVQCAAVDRQASFPRVAALFGFPRLKDC